MKDGNTMKQTYLYECHMICLSCRTRFLQCMGSQIDKIKKKKTTATDKKLNPPNVLSWQYVI